MAAATRLPPSPFLLCYLKDALLFPGSTGKLEVAPGHMKAEVRALLHTGKRLHRV